MKNMVRTWSSHGSLEHSFGRGMVACREAGRGKETTGWSEETVDRVGLTGRGTVLETEGRRDEAMDGRGGETAAG